MSEITITRAAPRGMITLRGDLSLPALGEVATGITGAAMPGQGEASLAGENGLLWMSPDEVLLILPVGEVGAALKRIGAALAGTHHLAVDVSDARMCFTLNGPRLREVLSKLTPADLRPASFDTGQVRRSRIAQVPAAFWLTGESRADLVCFRSVADYAEGLLRNAADPAGAVWG